MPQPQLPSIGRVVHYVAHGTPVRDDGTQAFPPACRAAIITEVGEYPEGISDADRSQIAVPVGLAVLDPSGMFFHQGAIQSEIGHEGGTWHWPERIPDGAPQNVTVNVSGMSVGEAEIAAALRRGVQQYRQHRLPKT